MRLIPIAALLWLMPLGASAAPGNQAIAKGSYPVPGALVCPDFRALQAAFRSFSTRRGPYPEYFGCRMVPPGTLVSVEGADPGGAPVVSAVLPSGEPVRGVTLNDMIEAFVSKQPAPPKPGAAPGAPAAKTATAKQDTAPGKIPLPALHNSPDTPCEPTRACTDEEFAGLRAKFEKRWALMPDSVRKKCQTKMVLPEMEQCVAEQTMIRPGWTPNSSINTVPSRT